MDRGSRKVKSKKVRMCVESIMLVVLCFVRLLRALKKKLPRFTKKRNPG